MKITKIDISKLEQNAGQIDGLPTNPRTWTRKDVESLARSLIETPELFEARPIIVIPHGEKYVILGGNMRYEASRLNGAKDVPCIVFPASLSFDKMREIVIKDNGSWGYWDYTLLENDWSETPLQDWGVPESDARGGGRQNAHQSLFFQADKSYLSNSRHETI